MVSTESDSQLAGGSQVDHFKTLRLLGRGGMGEVYLARGLAGIWSLRDGRLLGWEMLHGPAVHLARRGGRLFVASELADARVWNMSVFGLSYCAFMRQIWRRVPISWERGLPVRSGMPRRHRCLATNRHRKAAAEHLRLRRTAHLG